MSKVVVILSLATSVVASALDTDYVGPESEECEGQTCTDVGNALLQSKIGQGHAKRGARRSSEMNDCDGCFDAWDDVYVEGLCTGSTGAGESLLQSSRARGNPHHLILRHQVDANANLLYYGSVNIDQAVPNRAQLAVMFLHGGARDAVNYFCSLKRIMEEQQSYDPRTVLMISPKFAYEDDLVEDPEDDLSEIAYEDDFVKSPGDLWWNGSKDNPVGDYRLGAHSDPRSGGHFSSFDLLDRLVLKLENEDQFPNLDEIIILGHSAGGQTVQRYALTTHLNPTRSHVQVRYAIANPSTYAYLDRNRWSYDCDDTACTEPVYREYDRDEGRSKWKADRRRRRADSPEDGGKDMGFWGVSSASGKHFICRTSSSSPEETNYWGYALIDSHPEEKSAYVADTDIDQAKEWYKERDVTYFVGQNDTCTDDLLKFCHSDCWQREIDNPTYNQPCGRTKMDMRCAGMLQGPNRRERGKHYMQHLEHYYGNPTHALHTINDVGHEAEAMFLSQPALDVLFPLTDAHQHDPDKCMFERDGVVTYKPNCCGAADLMCAEGWTKVQLGLCGQNNEFCRTEGCWQIMCIPPKPGHDPDKCVRRAGKMDPKCCSPSYAYCDAGYQKITLGDCTGFSSWCRDNGGCSQYNCVPP